MTTIENNRLIAEFMGMYKENEKSPIFVLPLGNDEYYIDLEDGDTFRFNSSWDWIMPVVVECFNRYDTIENNLSNHQFFLNDALLETNIASLYDVVVGFIKWYNKNK